MNGPITHCPVCGSIRPLGWKCATCFPPSATLCREPSDVTVTSDPTTGPAPAGGDITSSTPVAPLGDPPKLAPTADTVDGPATGVDMAAVRRALDAKDALLRRSRAMLGVARLTGERAPYRLELPAPVHLGQVAELVVAIELELEFVDPLGRL